MATNKPTIDDIITRGVERIYPSADVLKKTLAGRKKLRFYLGIDPTGPTLHIGHGVVLRKMRDLQQLGHQPILLIGDFTGMIGDPTDKSAARKRLTRDEVLKNAERYKDQASRFLRFEGKNAAELQYNSTWLASMTFEKVIELAVHFTDQQMHARDMFRRRIAEEKPIHLHEFLYPLMQGYDSVAMDVDLELGGNDQTFNMLAGRDLMQKMRQKEKYVMTMKLLVDPTGAKMGKTTGNMITFDNAPEEMFGKVMAWPDTMIAVGMELCTDIPMDDVRQVERDIKKGKGNPMEMKLRLARELVTLYTGADAARQAEEHFTKTVRRGEAPEEMPTVQCTLTELSAAQLLRDTKLVPSLAEARRVIAQRGMKINGAVVDNPATIVAIPRNGVVIQKGKRHYVRVYRR